MVATTDQKARLLDLTTGVLELVRDGNRDIGSVSSVLQIIKDDPCFETRLLPREESETEEPKLLLEFLGTVSIPATTERCVAKEKFREDTSKNARVKIYTTGSNFDKWFLGKVEEPISETELRYHRLRRPSVDEPILAELGGQEKAETTLTELYTLLEQQPRGEEGILLTNGCANIFYVKDVSGSLRSVCAGWGSRSGGWGLSAYLVGSPHGWCDGSRIFSRNS